MKSFNEDFYAMGIMLRDALAFNESGKRPRQVEGPWAWSLYSHLRPLTDLAFRGDEAIEQELREPR